MATKKSSSKSGAKKSSAAKKSYAAPKKIAPQPLYGGVIYDAIARGDAGELRRVRAAAVKHVADVESALAKLDAKLKG